MKPPRRATYRIDVYGVAYYVSCHVFPARYRHESADAPGYPNPPQRARLEIVRVMRDGRDITHAVDAELSLMLRYRAARIAGLPFSSAAMPKHEEQTALQFARTENAPADPDIPAGRYWGPFWNHHDGLD